MKNIFSIILVFQILSSSNLFALGRADLVVGKYYKIQGDVALLHKPEIFINEWEFKNNLIVVLNSGSIVQIIEKKGGIFSRFFKVNFIRDGKVKLKGWLASETIKNATEVSRETAFYVKPIKKYNPDKEEIDKVVGNYDDVVGIWVDSEKFGIGIYVLRKVSNSYKVDMFHKDGSKTQRMVILSKQSQGNIKIDYDNKFGEYDIIDSGGGLSFYDKDGFYKSLKTIQYKEIEFSSPYKPTLLPKSNNVKPGTLKISNNESEFLLIIEMARDDAKNDLSTKGLTKAVTSGAITSLFLTPFFGGLGLIGYNHIFQIKDIPEIPKQRIQKLRDENRSQTFVDNYSFIYQEEALKTLNKNRLNGNTYGCILILLLIISNLS